MPFAGLRSRGSCTACIGSEKVSGAYAFRVYGAEGCSACVGIEEFFGERFVCLMLCGVGERWISECGGEIVCIGREKFLREVLCADDLRSLRALDLVNAGERYRLRWESGLLRERGNCAACVDRSGRKRVYHENREDFGERFVCRRLAGL